MNINNNKAKKAALCLAAVAAPLASFAQTGGGSGNDWGTTFSDAATQLRTEAFGQVSGIMPILLGLLAVTLIPSILKTMYKRFSK